MSIPDNSFSNFWKVPFNRILNKFNFVLSKFLSSIMDLSKITYKTARTGAQKIPKNDPSKLVVWQKCEDDPFPL